MSEYTIKKFINDQINDVARDLNEIQIKIQKEQKLSSICLFMYLQACMKFNFFLTASLNDVCENIRLDYIVFQKAKMNYELVNYYFEMLSALLVSLDNSKRMEKITSKDYAELVMLREDNYNLKEFATFIYRNNKRFEEIFI